MAAAPGRPGAAAGPAAQRCRPRLAAVTLLPPRPTPQSLLATGLTQPEHVLQHCLALYRKADLAGLRQYLPESYAAALAPPEPPAGPAAAAAGDAAGAASSGAASSSSSGGASGSGSRAPALPVGPWFKIRETGPLAPLAGVLDVGARRVLPGHLLRRSQVRLH